MHSAPSLDVAVLKKSLLAKLGEGHADLYPVEVEKHFPRILERIVDLWNAPELDHYLEDLLTTTRHDRQGFPEVVALELIHLASFHASYRLSGLTSKNPWDVSFEHDLNTKPD